jgi:hypothetical protein
MVGKDAKRPALDYRCSGGLEQMKLLNAILLSLLALGAYADNVSVVAHVLDATDFVAHISVTVKNNATPTTMNVTATVNYQRFGFDEEVISTPVVIAIQHPVTVKGINLSFPGDWVCLTPFSPVTVLDGQSFETTMEYAKVTVRL